MSRYKLKHGGRCRRKAAFGIDGAITGAATLAAAGINALATKNAAETQARAVIDNAKTQAQSIKDQTENNNRLQKDNMAFTRAQNQENRQLQQDIQTSLQMMAGRSNMNSRMERNKIQVKYGGKPKRQSINSPFYGEGRFQVTDGGGVIPIVASPDGSGLYELYGNDHKHYHKTPKGKSKTGVGIKFNDGSVVEGEGNQNTNQGELLYVTPNDAMFISKHSIAGFNPAQAVNNGVHPAQAFAIQEALKEVHGYNDDGSKTTSPVEGLNYNRSIAKCGGKRKLKCGGRKKAAWGDYAGAVYNAAGNLLGAGIGALGNMWASNKVGSAYTQAGNIMADAYSQMHGIDLSELDKEDFKAAHTLAVIRDPNTNINPQLERIRRNSNAERREINRGSLSSAARQQRLAGINDRMFQRMGEQYSYKTNTDEQVKQANAQSITQTAQANADRDIQANINFGNQRMQLLQYNNEIENNKIAGIAQSKADALTQTATAKAQAIQNSMNAIGGALTASGMAFGTASDNVIKNRREDAYAYSGLSSSEKKAFAMSGKDSYAANRYYNEQMQIYNDSTTYENRQKAWENINAVAKANPRLSLIVPDFSMPKINVPSRIGSLTPPGTINRNSIIIPPKLN